MKQFKITKKQTWFISWRDKVRDICESNGCSYAIRLKQNPALIALTSDKEEDLYQATQKDQISYAVTYGEFMYQAGSWKYPRRVVFKIEKPYGQLTHMYTFIVTNMDMEPYQIIQFYCGRGNPFRKIYHIQTV